MKQPQKLALELNEIFPNPKLKAIGDFACCCLTLMWYLDLDFTDIDAIKTVAGLINKKVNNQPKWADYYKSVSCIPEDVSIQFLVNPKLLQYSTAVSNAKSRESVQCESDVIVILASLVLRYSIIKGEG